MAGEPARKSKIIETGKHEWTTASVRLSVRHWRWLEQESVRRGMSCDDLLNLLVKKHERWLSALPVTPETPGDYTISDIIRSLIEIEWA